MILISGGFRNYQGGGRQAYYLAKFRQKLHENEKNWTDGDARPKLHYVDPPLLIDIWVLALCKM